MNVFVTGAAGFVGSAVAAAFARAGHDVRGLTRNPAKRALLAAMEVEAVVGSMQSPASYRDVAARCEVLVHAAIEYGPESWSLDRKTIETLLGTARPGAPRLVVYTSGVWVHGESRGRTMDETTPIAPPPFVARRAEHEALVRGADDGRGLRTLVVRPGCVYGGAGGLTAAWFDGALKGGAARIVGHGENHWAMVHRDDLARVYVLAAESWLGGETIDVVDGAETTVLDCARAASEAVGAGGRTVATDLDEALRAMGPIAECLALDQRIDGSKVRGLLGWTPRHRGFAAGAARYARSFRAAP
ncbi:MAG: NAD-dependent epimerase/dehydratase family protein [Candidatus Polarisedimenticolia bacterium]